MIAPLRRPVRALRLSAWVLYGIVLATVFPLLGRRLRGAIIQHWARRILHILNVHVHVAGDITQGSMVVANHVSWLDIIVFLAMTPARFVAKEEVRRWPVFGRLAAHAGTLFIQRQRRADSARVVAEIDQLLRDGERIILFPEGTTSDGHVVLPFKSALLEAAVQSGCSVLPVALRYQHADGTINGTPAFTGDCTLLESLWRILDLEVLHVALWCGGAYRTNAMGRREAATIAHNYVGEILQRTGRQQRQVIRLRRLGWTISWGRESPER